MTFGYSSIVPVRRLAQPRWEMRTRKRIFSDPYKCRRREALTAQGTRKGQNATRPATADYIYICTVCRRVCQPYIRLVRRA